MLELPRGSEAARNERAADRAVTAAMTAAARPAPAALPPIDSGRGLLILDDWFPNLLTGFRVAEFVHYLRCFPRLRVGSLQPHGAPHYQDFARLYPDVADRVVPCTPQLLAGAGAAWFVFLNNADRWLADVERHRLPFAFTLYPGGGFNLNDAESTAKLSRVLASPMLRAVVATQPVTLEVLRDMRCPVPVHEVPGVVVNPAYVAASQPRTALRCPDEIRICFAAFRYDPHGRSKGYPEFITAAAMLAQMHPRLRFAAVGDFGPEDWPVPPALQDRLAVHGPLATNDLHRFLPSQDVIISPTRRLAVTGRGFDGFPTGATVEAALCGLAVVASDELNQNRHYRPGEDILICAAEPTSIVATLDPFLRDPARLLALAERGRRRTVDLYGVATQLQPRTRLLRALAAEVGAIL